MSICHYQQECALGGKTMRRAICSLLSLACEDYLRLDLCVDALASSHVSSEVSSLFSLLRKCLSKGIENLLSDVKASIEVRVPN